MLMDGFSGREVKEGCDQPFNPDSYYKNTVYKNTVNFSLHKFEICRF